MQTNLDLAFKWFVTTAVMASLVMLGIVVWLFVDGEPEGAWAMLLVLVIGYATLGWVWTARRRES